MVNASKKSKTDLLLETIQPKEFMNFERYLVSKLGRSHNIDYYGYWSWKKEQILNSLKGKPVDYKPYEHTLSRKFLSDFNKLIEGYFMGVSVERDKQLQSILLLNEMRKRKVDKLFSDYLKKSKGLNKNKLLKGLISDITSLRFNFEEYILLNALNDEQGMVNLAGDICHITEIVYFQNVLFNFINIKLLGSSSFEPCLNFEMILQRIEKDISDYEKNHKNVYVLYLIALLIKDNKSVNDLMNVVSYLNKNEKLLTPEYLKIAYESVLRFSMFKINVDNMEDLKKVYGIFKEVERKGIMNKIPNFQPLVFFSLFSFSFLINDINFAEKLVTKYSSKLFCVPHDDVLSVCNAMLYYERGKLNSAKALLIKLRVKNVSMYIYSRLTLLKVLYDKNELRGIMSLADTIKHYMNRKDEVNEELEHSVGKFLSFMTNLSLAKRKSGRGLMQLRERFDLEKSFFMKKWVSDKLVELEKIYIQ
ncbi:MAG: hypothetical protein NTY74_09165 [Ignavibacteriae bacterium]|nr:hypothetical protein [Ignavibacteriota bacterium]